VLVEGFFSVMKLYEAGVQHVVAAMGCELSERQAELLAQFPEVVVLFDGDEAGRAGAEAAKARLQGRTIVRTIHLPDGRKPDDLSARALKWLINGVQLLDLEEVRYLPRELAPRA
jgi:DNA primase